MTVYTIKDVSFDATYFCPDDQLILLIRQRKTRWITRTPTAQVPVQVLSHSELVGLSMMKVHFYHRRLGLPDFSIPMLLIRQAI